MSWIIYLILTALGLGTSAHGAMTGVEQVPSTSVDKLEGAQVLGPLRIGMSRAQVESLPFRFQTSTVQIEGDDYIKDKVRIRADQTVEVTFWDGRAVELTTKSKSYLTREGAHVGNTLGELRRIYPNGQTYTGQAEGLYFTFDTGIDSQFFVFDTEELGRDCIVNGAHCSHKLSESKSVTLSVR